MGNGQEYERRQSVADAAYEAQGGVMLLKQRIDNHEKICGERYQSLQSWLKTTFFTLLTGFCGVIFYIITRHQ